ncbi:MAG: superoxide dismutase [Candidatus Kerfeldbacteria bacterium CG_4_10_14_0_8_um_filter_42_10]|uniref:Superoxide dismutase n=1 Tax=Candidatus Kerfeldbacteria bacterium CG_4_10_14_0_8_um_filter_42_10 TaxID=2014248 RepID=A0A2M7RGY9_9BACT|nr:MAG: superoxide dismutase [Candidatus Kerfeldbacteria bacterium CG_4_10_14_0_8_um_filter_42_10]
MKYELPKLNYAYDALEPFIDASTMEIHHSKHHQAYTDNFNKALAEHPDLGEMPVEELLAKVNELSIDQKDKNALRNHGGGYYNHKLFWELMDPSNKKDEALIKDIKKEFGSVDSFKEQFSETAKTLFGSGWAWLVRNEKGRLRVYGLPNQDSPFQKGHTPIIGLDVWEHAYYLKYQNRRPEYIENWWNVLKLI